MPGTGSQDRLVSPTSIRERPGDHKQAGEVTGTEGLEQGLVPRYRVQPQSVRGQKIPGRQEKLHEPKAWSRGQYQGTGSNLNQGEAMKSQGRQ